MRKFLVGFLGFVALYHILVTFFSFGISIFSPYVLLFIRDIGWLLVVIGVALTHWQTIKQHFRQWGTMWQFALLLGIVAITTSVLLGTDVEHIIIGIKYTLYYLVPFLTAVYIGTYLYTIIDKRTFQRRIFTVWKLLICIIVIGWVWQIAKMYNPDFFAHFGYGPLGDYVFGEKPPLYYLTGPHGIPRLSGIFSGPNNYGYFLVVFFGFFWYGLRTFIKSKVSKGLLWALYIGTVLATLSRGAILGVLTEVILISLVLYRTKKHIVIWAMVLGIAAVVSLSALKWQSTVAHVSAKLHSLEAVSQSPWGYGLGSSGPSVHSQGGYLPENFFVQIMMDMGIHGFILWAGFWLLLFRKIREIYFAHPLYRTILFFLSIGFVGIMVEGLFLHVLEDSMVNYMYFVVRGVTLGYITMTPKTSNKLI